MMIEDYDGLEVRDATGERIGSVERSYVDERGFVHFVEVKIRGLRAKHRLVPTDNVERAEDGLAVPFSKDVIEESPDASSAGDTLEESTLDEVRAYYERQRAESGPSAIPIEESDASNTAGSSTSRDDEGIGAKVRGAVEHVREKLPSSSGAENSDSQATESGQIRDIGDVIEVPIVEEEMVKRPVVKEVLRIRKSSTTERKTVQGDVRKESVDVIPEGDIPVDRVTEEK